MCPQEFFDSFLLAAGQRDTTRSGRHQEMLNLRRSMWKFFGPGLGQIGFHFPQIKNRDWDEHNKKHNLKFHHIFFGLVMYEITSCLFGHERNYKLKISIACSVPQILLMDSFVTICGIVLSCSSLRFTRTIIVNLNQNRPQDLKESLPLEAVGRWWSSKIIQMKGIYILLNM